MTTCSGRLTDLPLLVLALAMIPPLIVPAVTDLSAAWDRAFLVGDWFIWAVFAVDFGIKLSVAPARLQYIRHHWLEAGMVVLPFLRPLRLVRLVRFSRLAVLLGFNASMLREIASQRGTKVVLAAVLATLVAGALLVYLAEHDEDGANIATFGDAVWWAVTTMTTVGYGDRFPTTPMGRGVAVALMLIGVAALSALTATIAAFLVRERETIQLSDVLLEVQALRRELGDLRQREIESP